MLNYLISVLSLRSDSRTALLSRLRREDRGATAVEYGLMVALIAVAIVGMVFLLGDNLGSLFGGVADEVANPDGQ